MATTIDIENAKQIRKPMEIYIHFFAGSSASISSYGVTSTYKSYDSTLDNTSWTMRNITDLANGGFPLDGSCEWFDSAITPSATDGKLGLRGTVGSNVVVSISSASTLTSITIATKNVEDIIHGANTYPSLDVNVIPINSTSATLTFTPADANARIEINYIVPGAEFTITNDNLVSCNLALRGNLNVIDHTWEESEIEISMYYPYNIADTFAYIGEDFPITYQAGYDDDLSQLRKFYLSEPIEQNGNVISIHGVDASHLLENITMPEQWMTSITGKSHQMIYEKFYKTISDVGINVVNYVKWSGSSSGATQYAILPEMLARDFVSDVMNLTLNHKRGSTFYGIQFVDAGIPSVEFGDGKTFGNTWNLNKSDCAEWIESFDQNISTIKNSDSDHKINESISISNNYYRIQDEITGEVNQIIETNFDGFYMSVAVGHTVAPSGSYTYYAGTPISSTPTRFVFKIKTKGNYGWLYVLGRPSTITGGTNRFSNPNGLSGIVIEVNPTIYGTFTDSNGETVFNYPSVFNRSLRTGSFKFKGDPRMQPLDYINVTNDTSDGRGNVTARITSIELTHEAGGTTAVINWREWN